MLRRGVKEKLTKFGDVPGKKGKQGGGKIVFDHHRGKGAWGRRSRIPLGKVVRGGEAVSPCAGLRPLKALAVKGGITFAGEGTC